MMLPRLMKRRGVIIADIFIAGNPTLRRVFHPPPTIIRAESRIRNKGKNDSRSIKDEREICRSTGFIRWTRENVAPLPLWRKINQAYLSDGSGHELVTKWVTLGLIREHRPSLHEKRKRENMEGEKRVCSPNFHPASQPASQLWNIKSDRMGGTGYAEYFNYTGERK